MLTRQATNDKWANGPERNLFQGQQIEIFKTSHSYKHSKQGIQDSGL